MKKEIVSGIYAIFNLVNGKVYIGQSGNLAQRYKEHWSNKGVNGKHNRDISDDFELYTVTNFLFIILEFVLLPFGVINDIDNCRAYLKPYEDKWIDYYECLNPLYGYNKIYGGVTTLGASFYQEQEFKDKISKSLKEYYKNNPVTEETKQRISDNLPDNSGVNNPMYGRRGELHPNYGKHPLEESIEKNRQSNLGIQAGSKNPMYGKRGKLSPIYGHDGTIPGKEAYLHFPNGKHYLEINTARFCNDFGYDPGNMNNVILGKIKSCKGVTGERAPKWLVDKVKPLMKPGQYWVEVDLDGNIING